MCNIGLKVELFSFFYEKMHKFSYIMKSVFLSSQKRFYSRAGFANILETLCLFFVLERMIDLCMRISVSLLNMSFTEDINCKKRQLARKLLILTYHGW